MKATWTTWTFWGFAGVGAYFLLTEHRAHVFDYLPYVLLLACPLMHLFHRHGGHRHGDHEQGSKPRNRRVILKPQDVS